MRPKLIAALVWLLAAGFSVASAQPGRGQDRPGMARSAEGVERYSMSGTVEAVEMKPRNLEEGHGAHLRVSIPEGPSIELHLGPLGYIEEHLPGLKVGERISFEAFRDPELPENHYVAISLTRNGKEVTLRDESLRPRWAGSSFGGGQGQGHRGRFRWD